MDVSCAQSSQFPTEQAPIRLLWDSRYRGMRLFIHRPGTKQQSMITPSHHPWPRSLDPILIRQELLGLQSHLLALHASPNNQSSVFRRKR